MSSREETIFALSSGGLPSGVAVVRVSGPLAAQVCQELCGALPANRMATLLPILDLSGLVIDHGLVLYFAGPRSFTGEDCLEFQVHGGRAVVQSLVNCLGAIPGLRHAEAGEFSRRAFENGKMDLVEVEGLSDLISADTEMQRRLALEQARGGLTETYQGWARRLTHARAMIEAELDFADEGDVPGSVADQIWNDMAALGREIEKVIANLPLGEIIRDGLNVVIAGAPNSGKSSLLNALARRDVAIVTNIPGTTRDVVQVDINIGGFLVHLKDTAGLRDTGDIVEQEGIRRAREAIVGGDLVLHLVDLSDAGSISLGLVDTEVPVIRVGTKSDLMGRVPDGLVDEAISVKTGAGLDSLLKRIISDLELRIGNAVGSIPSRRRHLDHLVGAKDALRVAVADRLAPLEIRAEYLRRAGDCLGRITGRVDTETLLGVIFSEFCIGK